MADAKLSKEQTERYARNILLSEVGEQGQARLLASSALVVGAGGLGSPALLYLAAAGVGRLGIADGDVLEPSNLQRQIIHRTADLGKVKALSARQAIRALNPDCTVDALPRRLTAENVRGTVRNYDVVLDCSDNFATRFMVADAARLEGKPLVSAAVLRFDGQLLTVLPGEGNPCYRCFVAEPPPADAMPGSHQAGILGAVAGVMGSLQATEAIKVLLRLPDLLSHRLLVYDGLRCRFATVKRQPSPACPLCGPNPRMTKLDVTDRNKCGEKD